MLINGGKITLDLLLNLKTLILLVLTIQIAQLVALRSVTNFETRLVLIYNSNSELPASTTSNFTISFSSAFPSIPAVAIGNAGYSSLDRYYNEFWSITSTINSNYTGMIVHVRVEANTKTNVLYICFLAVDDSAINVNLFNIFYSQFSTQLVNTSRGTGTRSDTIIYSPTGSANFSTSSYVTCITNTLYMRNNANFAFSVICQLELQVDITTNQTYSNSVKFVVGSAGQNILEKIGFYTIIINKNLISGINYYQTGIGSIIITSSQSTSVLKNTIFYTFNSAAIANQNVQEIKNSAFFMALLSMGGDPGASISFNWEFNMTNATQYIKFNNPFSLSQLTYNFIVFGRVDCSLWSYTLQTCVNSCQTNQTDGIFKPICFPCSSACATCLSLPNICSSCSAGYFLNGSNCLTCNSSNLTQAEKSACGIIDPAPAPQPVAPSSNPPIWLASLAVIPVLVTILICYYRQKKIQKVVPKDASGFSQYPSMEL